MGRTGRKKLKTQSPSRFSYAILNDSGIASRFVQSIQKSRGTKPKTFVSKAQVLPVTLIVGAVLLIFALAMVSILSNTIKLSTKVNAGTWATLVSDAVVNKSINILSQGNNWGSPPGLTLTPLPGFKSDVVYTDIPNAQYVVQIDAGNLLKPPGDLAYQRTVSVDMYSLQSGQPTPSASPTPWVRGGPLPIGWINHRRIQAVLQRGSMTASIIAGGTINVGGNWRVYWGDIYDYFDPGPVTCSSYPCTNYTTITLGGQPLGPGYPAVHTQVGCISSSGSCGGCFGGTGSTNSTVCLTTDTGAVNCKLYPNDPNMPPKPDPGVGTLKSTAQKFYVPGVGMPGAGLPSHETGYFYSTTCTTCPTSNSQGGGAAGAANEANHQYTGTNFGLFFGGNTQLANVLARMAQNLGLSSSWGGNDDLVCFVDTTDGKVLQSDLSNAANGGSAIGLKQAGYVGTLAILGSIDDNGGSNFGINTTMNPPDNTWCPGTTTSKVVVNGFLYIGGAFHSTGSPTFYGSVDDEGDFSGKGTPTLYYRKDFKYNLIESGKIAITGWQEVQAFPTPLP